MKTEGDVTIGVSGVVGRPVALPKVIGTRTMGSNLIGDTIAMGRSPWRVSDVAFDSIGNPIRVPQGLFKDLTVRNVTARNVHRFLEMARDAELQGVTIENLKVEIAARAAMRFFKARDISIRNLVVDFGKWSDGKSGQGSEGYIPSPSWITDRLDQIMMGVHLEGDGENVTVEDAEIRNAWSPPPKPGEKRWRQGDGFCTEGGFRKVRVKNLRVFDCTDGCVDTKAADATYLGLYTEGGARGVRWWAGDGLIDGWESHRPWATHLHMLNVCGVIVRNWTIHSYSPTVPFVTIDGAGTMRCEIESYRVVYHAPDGTTSQTPPTWKGADNIVKQQVRERRATSGALIWGTNLDTGKVGPPEGTMAV